jgi:hypothetical protein
MCAVVQITVRRASNILSRENQMTGAETVLMASAPGLFGGGSFHLK